MKRRFLVIFISLCFASASGLAQSVQKDSVPNGLALKIVYFKGRPTAYQRIPDAAAKIGGAWYALFQTTPNWQPTAAALPVRAVNIISRMEGDAVKVNVSVFTGQRVYDKEEFVADYLLRENEKVKVSELAKFGVEPFEISVVKVVPSVAVLPSVVNKTTSLEASAEPNHSTLPSYKMKFLNNSGKVVSAFSFATFLGARAHISSMPQGLEGKPLINPGEIYERILPSTFEREMTADEKTAAAGQNETFVITAVMFEDETFEGDAQQAGAFRVYTFGRKIQLKKIVPLLRKASDDDFKNGELSRQISNLDSAADETDLNEYFQRFPDMTEREKLGFRGAARADQHIKYTILNELKTFQANQKKMEAIATQDWIKATKEKYQNWLVRLL